MSPKTFFNAVTAIFFLIAVLHVARLVYGWEAMIGGWVVPMWLSWVALVIAGFLAWHGWRLGKNK